MKNKRKKEQTEKKSGLNLSDLAGFLLVGVTVLCLCLFCLFCFDNLMHSDTTAEVILSKLLRNENRFISPNWFYSTEIRIVYSHLIMMPLFYLTSDMHLVKLISIFIFYVLLILAYVYLVKRFKFKRSLSLLVLALLFAPVSNEYLDMMFIGCFYTSQTICSYLILSRALKKENSKKEMWIAFALQCVAAFILGLSGLRYLASLYLPLLLGYGYFVFMEKGKDSKDNLYKLGRFFVMTGFAGAGFLVNKGYLATHYSFDTTSQVAFVPLSEVPDRFINSIKLMLEFMGYRQLAVVTPLGLVNTVKFAFFLLLVGMTVYLWIHKKELLTEVERIFLYFFVFLFAINWYMLIFTDVLMQYRYWLIVYVFGIFLFGIGLSKIEFTTKYQKLFITHFLALVVLASLYGELWQDTKYNDCEKRYGYMEFLQENEYDFGYATFWNASVTEFLANGDIHVGSLGGNDWGARPYEWLSPKEYYRAGYHQGKVFLLLARSEEAGMLKGDFTIMDDAKLVYEDEYYAIYEGQEGMYLYSEGYEP